MKKKIILEFENGIDPKYKKWTREAAQKFVSFFPEFKDNFEVEFDRSSFFSKAEVEDIALRSTQVSKQDVWDMFERQADGSYLRKNSIDWQINQASTNGKVDLQQWLTQKGGGRASVPLDEPLRISVAARGTTFAYGISNQAFGPCLSASACGSDEAYFKDIVMHELGHSFDASHEKRKNTVEELGMHCTDADCLMYKHAYKQKYFNQRQALQQDNPFCNDCMESMREYMQNTLKMTRTKNNVNLQDNENFLDCTNQTEVAFLKAYDDYRYNSNLIRKDEDVFLDKMLLLAEMRRNYNNSNQYRASYIKPETFNFNSTAKTDWSNSLSFKALRIALYEAKKTVCYDTDLFDKTRRPTRNADGSIPAFAVGGQTIKGDELAKVLIDTQNMEVKANLLSESWVYRMPPNRGSDDFVEKPTAERFAINAQPNIDLIQKLDDFAKKYKVYYKTATPTKWHQRNDPVVIYCSEQQTPSMIKELKSLVSPYIRKAKPDRINDLDGTLLADGLITAKEPNKDNLKDLFDEIKAVNQHMAQSLKDEIAQQIQTHHNNPLSLGQIEAYRLMLKSYKSFMSVNNTTDKTVTVNHDTNLPSEKATDKSFKKALREVFEPSAKKEGSEYKEDLRAQNYEAQIKHSDGSIDRISASSATNLSLSAQDKDGKEKLPEMQRFHDIAEYTHRQKSFVSFGDIKTTEFKARLMIACMTHNPPVRMKGQPEANPEFLNSLDAALKKQLETAINPPKPEPKQKPTPRQQGGR